METPATETPDYKAVMRASPDLRIISVTLVPETQKLFLVFLSSGSMAIPAEYDTETGRLTVYTYASPCSYPISESMMTTALFFGDSVLLGINGVLLFRNLSISIPSLSAPNLSPSDIPTIMRGTPVVTDTVKAEFSDGTNQIMAYTAYPVNDYTFILGLAGEDIMGFYTMTKEGLEETVSSSPMNPSQNITLFDSAYPYMTILHYDHEERKTHFWSMVNHTVFNMDTGAVISTSPYSIATADGTVLENTMWSYGMYARAPVTKRSGRFQAAVMLDDNPTRFYHAESTDGNTWTATLIREEDKVTDIYAGSVDIGESWLCYRYTESDSTAIAVVLCLADKSGGDDIILASETMQLSGDDALFQAIVRPAIIEKNGRFYAGLPHSIVSWAIGEESATIAYETDGLLIDLIESDNGLILIEYIETEQRYKESLLDTGTGTATESKAVNGRMFDYVCGSATFAEGSTEVSTYISGSSTEDIALGLIVSASGVTYSITEAGTDSIMDWLAERIISFGISRYLHLSALYAETASIADGEYDAMNETGRAIAIPDSEIEESGFIIADSAVVDIRERDNAIEIRMLPFSYDTRDFDLWAFSEITMQPCSLFYGYFGKCLYIGNPDVVEPFIVIHKDSEDPVGVTFHWNFPAQLTSTAPDALLRAPILRDGAMNSNADTAIPDDFIDSLPE